MRSFTHDERVSLTNGDRQAWDRLCREVAVRVELLIRLRMNHRLQRRVSVEDVSQVVLMQLASSSLDPGADGQALGAWVRQAVKHVIVDQYRKHVDASRRSLNSEVEDNARMGHAVSSAPSPTRFARQRERVEALWTALACLSKAYRDVLVHRFLEGRSVAETAQLLGKTEGAVSVQQHRALCRLRESYAGAEPTGH